MNHTSSTTPTHTLIAKVTLQNLLQQVQQAEILLTFGNGTDPALPQALHETLQRIRKGLQDLEYRVQAI